METMNHESAGSVENDPLYFEVFESLIGDEALDNGARAVIDGALRGDAAFAQACAEDGAALSRRAPHDRKEPAAAPRIFIQEIVVEGFRGAGPKATLKLPPGPGLTLVTGRNGTGKSTFVDALETILASDDWAAGGQDRKKSWRNLYQTAVTEVSCVLMAEGVGTYRAARRWNATCELGEGKVTFEANNASTENAPNWEAACKIARPFLGHRELGKVGEKSAEAYDALRGVLGMDLLEDAASRLNSKSSEIKDAGSDAINQLKDCRNTLAGSPSVRIQILKTLLDEKKPALESVVNELRALQGERRDAPSQLVAFARQEVPTEEEWDGTTLELEVAISRAEAVSSVNATASVALLDLLDLALPRLSAEPSHCPVCAQPLSAQHHEEISSRANALRQSTQDHSAAQSGLNHALARVERLVSQLPNVKPELLAELGIDSGLSAEVQTLKAGLKAAPALVLATLTSQRPLLGQVVRARQLARDELNQQDFELRALIAPVELWVERQGTVERANTLRKSLDKAKTWLKEETQRTLNRRFAPLREATLENWRTLARDSSVLLTGVELASSGTRRKVELDVEVDGLAAPGVSVLSQGEINCMALSLFLPRAVHSGGPFSFVLIDDPVQAMDHFKVDGLARVLHRAAEKLQVVVFTHDTRLVSSLQRLQLPTHVLEVRRHVNSRLEITPLSTPVERYLKDADSVALAKGMGDELPYRVVPNFCRLAVEAACQEKIYRVRLARGESFESLEERLKSLSLFDRVALALLDDEKRGSEVAGHLKTNGALRERDALFQMKAGSHGGTNATNTNLRDLIHWTRKLCQRILDQ